MLRLTKIALLLSLIACGSQDRSSISTAAAVEKENLSDLDSVSTDFSFSLKGAANDSAVELANKLNAVSFSTFRPKDLVENHYCVISFTELQPIKEEIFVHAQISCERKQNITRVMSLSELYEIIQTELTARTGLEFTLPIIDPNPSVTGANGRNR